MKASTFSLNLVKSHSKLLEALEIETENIDIAHVDAESHKPISILKAHDTDFELPSQEKSIAYALFFYLNLVICETPIEK